VTPCQLKSSYQCFGAESSSAASLTVYQLTQLYFPEDFNWNINQHQHENPTSPIINYLVFVIKKHFFSMNSNRIIKYYLGARFSEPVQTGPGGPSSLLYNEYQVFPRGKEWSRHEADPSPPSSAMVMKE
jgi:hypothetical protein